MLDFSLSGRLIFLNAPRHTLCAVAALSVLLLHAIVRAAGDDSDDEDDYAGPSGSSSSGFVRFCSFASVVQSRYVLRPPCLPRRVRSLASAAL